MSDRIRQLEDALAIMQSSTTRETHPLLRPDLLTIKSGLELHSASHFGSGEHGDASMTDAAEKAIDHFGTLAVHDDGAARYLGWSAGTEVSASLPMFIVILRRAQPHVYTESAPGTSHSLYV